MAKAKGGYLGLGYLVSVILAIIPVTSLVLGIITAIQRGHILWAIVRIFIGWNIFWIIDLICMIVYGKIWILV